MFSEDIVGLVEEMGFQPSSELSSTIVLAWIQVVYTCIPCRRQHVSCHRRQNCRHGYMYPLVSASRTLLRTCIVYGICVVDM